MPSISQGSTINEHEVFVSCGLGFDYGKEQLWQDYKQRAQEFFKLWYPPGGGEPTEDEIERQFWRIVERKDQDKAVVEYGNDIDSADRGSGFRTGDPSQFRGCDGWNLNVLPITKGSVLRHLPSGKNGPSLLSNLGGSFFSFLCFALCLAVWNCSWCKVPL